MPFTIPSADEALAPLVQSQVFETDLAILVAALSGTGVVSGCTVTAQGSPDMTVAVAAGTILAAGVAVAVTGGNLTVGAADATNPRVDLISASAAGVKTITAGVAAAVASVKPPDLPSGHVGLAFVYVAPTDTAINTNEITDKRAVLIAHPLVGWAPWAGPLIFDIDAAFLTGETLAANGGTMVIPVVVSSRMLLQTVGLRNRDTSLARSWEWRLYAQSTNSGDAAENTLAEVAGANGSESFTAAAASSRSADAVSAPVYLAPGIYWLAIRNTHATNTFAVAVNAMSAEYAPTLYQTKTLGSALGSTLDFVAATWVKVSLVPAIRMRGRVFGQTTAF